ncbi:MAG: ACP phosphodiesterase [Alcanivorax borkumensis]|uniref:acyl carrier protein phosphodiesterase n=1 Tax=Alcanivorax borkumensis TaxID=59754 RepID=UPI000324E4C2|nr:ACP phosphodiesterase [Alcanivorax sp. 97CO-5]OJH08225.1 MAG: ACP phosphodiesterase [Alcanivorax borkumensis]PKG00948.1 DUF479 domain-containing protein [Alcanivorax sp. 97CO-6]
MNYLAHLSLAQPTVSSKVGNVLGDFMRGVDVSELTGPLRRGLDNHRLVDHFTDHHPWVTSQRRTFSSGRRRFAGVALDVLFDHFLWQHWVRFYDVPREQAIAHHYRQLEQGLPLMHGPMQQRVERLIAFDLLNQYGDLTKVGEALDVIAARIRFANSFGGIIEEIGSRYRELEEGFLTFYPQLQAKVRESGLE